GGGPQSSLFPADKLRQVDALRSAGGGDAATKTLLDCTAEVIELGMTGENAKRSAIKNALDETTRSGFRSMEEHTQRLGSKGEAEFLRNRLDAARRTCNLDDLAD